MRVQSFVRSVRAAGLTDTPIVLVEPTSYSRLWFTKTDPYNISGVRAGMSVAYAALVAAGDEHLVYVAASALSPGVGPTEDLTYDGIRPLDRGHAILAEALFPVLKALLRRGGVSSASVPGAHHQGLAGSANAGDISAQQTPLDLAREDKMQTGHSEAHSRPIDMQAITWVDATTLAMHGRAFNTTPSPWNRLPAAAQAKVRAAVWGLSLNSAGIIVAFATDSPQVHANFTVTDPARPMVHFSTTGVSGVDLFAFDSDTQLYRVVSSATLTPGQKQGTLSLALPDAGTATRRFLLYCSSYNTVAHMVVGVSSGSSLVPDDPYATRASAKGPIVWYGTSILQGGVSFMPGNIITARVARALRREIYNFGFSGNGRMELDVAQYLVEAPRPACFIVDCSWNMDAASISAAAVPLIEYVRRQPGWGSVPIVMAEGLPFGRAWAVPAIAAAQNASNAALRTAYENLIARGDTNLHYMPTAHLFSPASLLDSATANGLHPTDAGMHDMAAAWISLLPTLLPD
jgi:lysophospholipase L1-like esterase